MRWLLIDLAVVLLGLLLVVLAGVRLYRAVRGLLRRTSAAGERVGRALEGLQAEPPVRS